MALIRTSSGRTSITPTYTTLFTSSGTANTLTFNDNYDEVIISIGGINPNTSFTYTGSGTLAVNRVVGTGSSGGAGYTQYRTYVSVYTDVKAGDTLQTQDLATTGGTVVIGVKY